jgi:hypothetical protein
MTVMPSSYGQQWTRYIRPGYSDQHIRVSDAERAEVADRLSAHYSDGRLDRAEFDERVARAMSAKTRADLNGLFDDLPDMGVGSATTGSPADTTVIPGRPGQPRRRGRPVLLAVLAIVLVGMATRAVVHMFFIPWLWIAVLAAVIVFATRASAHARRDR